MLTTVTDNVVFGVDNNSKSLIDFMVCYLVSRVMRKPAFCMCENKGADQLRDNHTPNSAFVFTPQLP